MSKGIMREIVESVAIAVILAAVIRIFLFSPFWIPSGSMQPTLMIKDRIIVNKFIYKFAAPKRGDIMVFRYPLDPKRPFVKRVIGLPGETVELKNNELYINGNKVAEPFLPKDRAPYENYGPYKVPQGQYFMLGDNRNDSQDSRVWGPLPKENIIGKSLVIYWPLSHLRVVD